MPITLFAVADPHYMIHLWGLLGSAKCFLPNAKVILLLVNPLSQDLDRLNADENIQVLSERLDFKDHREKAAYCANIRAKIIHQLLLDGHDRVIYMDADSLIRRQLNELLDWMDDYDLVIHRREENKNDDRVHYSAGIIGFRRSSESIKFVADWAKHIEEGSGEWFADQIGLAQTIRKHEDSLKLQVLPRSYIDWDLASRSHVWVGKANRKFEDNRYRVEELFYTRIFQEKSFLVSKLKHLYDCVRLYLMYRKEAM